MRLSAIQNRMGSDAAQSVEELRRENEDLRARLAAAEEALRAVRAGPGEAGVMGMDGKGAETVYRRMVETMGVAALHVTPEGRIMYCNESFGRFVGRPPQQLSGRSLEEFLEPGEGGGMREWLRECLREPVQRRVVFRALDGTPAITRLSGHSLHQEGGISVCLIAADLTELEQFAGQVDRLREDKRALEEAERELRLARLAALNLMEDAFLARERSEEAVASLRESEQRFRGTFENVAVGMAHQAPDGRWLRVNAKLCEITGYEREELLQMGFGEITHPDDIAADKAQAERLLAGEVPSYGIEKRYVRKDGSVVWIAVTVSLVRKADGEPDHFIKVVRDISLRKRTEEELSASRQRLAAIVESAMDAIICIGPDQRVVLFNKAAEVMFGCAAEEALGAPVERFMPERFRGSHGRQVDAFGRNGVTSRGMGRQGGPLMALRSDGEEFPIEASISRTEAAGERLYTVVLRDITERERAERAVRESEERLRLAAEATGFGTYDYDAVRQRLVWSPEFYSICGLSSASEPSLPLLRQLVHPEDLWQFDVLQRAALDPLGTGHHSLEFRIRCPEGEELWVRDVGRSFVEGEGEERRVMRVIGTRQNITRRKLAELQLRSSLQELKETQDLLVRKERLATLGQLAGSVAHELRTPLNVITNSVYFLRNAFGGNEGAVREVLEEMERAVGSSDHIIGEMLDFVREPSQHTADFPIGETIDRALKLIPPPPVIEVLRSGAGPDLLVHGNRDQIMRILTNLIQNAVHAMPGGGRLEIAVSLAKGGRVSVKVSDTGCGIPEENLAKIFEPLFTTKTKGIGLGLAISQRYVRLNRGWLFAQSQVGKGTTFHLILNGPGESRA